MVFGWSRAVIVWKLPVLLGCPFPHPVARESWLFLGLFFGGGGSVSVGFSSTQFGLYESGRKPLSPCFLGPKICGRPASSLPFRTFIVNIQALGVLSQRSREMCVYSILSKLETQFQIPVVLLSLQWYHKAVVPQRKTDIQAYMLFIANTHHP